MDKYFTKLDHKTYQIDDKVKACVEFRHHDLLKDSYPSDCHLIVCRNVLIYFTDEAKNNIYLGFQNALKKDGILFVGNTEQMLWASDLGYRIFKSFFYIKS